MILGLVKRTFRGFRVWGDEEETNGDFECHTEALIQSVDVKNNTQSKAARRHLTRRKKCVEKREAEVAVK